MRIQAAARRPVGIDVYTDCRPEGAHRTRGGVSLRFLPAVEKDLNRTVAATEWTPVVNDRDLSPTFYKWMAMGRTDSEVVVVVDLDVDIMPGPVRKSPECSVRQWLYALESMRAHGMVLATMPVRGRPGASAVVGRRALTVGVRASARRITPRP